ncbi:hypothetical protein NE237_003857 [Protea cynaroides]|uniref:Leucine-rich repeat-containing N-terminal plant-type domain-containing protein n=1 Tax=Protea cynaroides TaxID=273540 RepID=A0A9Q0KHI5_9MAGN|nr:hypothetical protein NE237_003857 [Protea cynaroides]
MGRFFAIGLVLVILCLLSIEKFACYGETHCLESDRKALIDFKNGLHDPEDCLFSWKGNDCCQWVGFWNLSGIVDCALLRLKSLRHLDLSLNTFEGNPIPECLGSLQALKYLNLSKAGFTGPIPPNLGNLSSLQYLDVSSDFSPLKADSLQWMAGLSSLRYLVMNGVDLSMVGSDWVPILNGLPFLTELHLSLCGLTNLIPSLQFVNFTSLAIMDLSLNGFNSKFPDWIVNISSLVSLDMSSSSLRGRIPIGISELPNLQHLNLAMNGNLTASCRQLLSGSWRSIEVLDLSMNSVHGILPSSIGNMTSLVDFDLFSNNVTGGIPSLIGFLCKLKSLNMESNVLTGGLPEFLEGTENCFSRSPFPSLMYLRLGPIPASLGRLSSLMDMGLGGNELNGSFPNSIGELSELVSLDVSFNQLTGIVSETHFSNLSNLKFLFMSSNSLILNISSVWVPPFQVHNLQMGSYQLGPSFPDWLETQKEINFLDISNASISGPIPDWFWDLSSNLSLLNVSFNQLQGQLPNPLPVASFADIDFNSNLLKGPISLPLVEIELLDLSANQFSGPIPLSIGDVQPYSVFLSLSGNIPPWIGESLIALRVLRLRSNGFSGRLPPQLSNISSLQVLDLANNKLVGDIPASLGDLQAMMQVQKVNKYLLYGKYRGLYYEENVAISIKGKAREFTKTLSLVTCIDLSGNNFLGEFPEAITNLLGFVVLNLSRNHISGHIPEEIANLHELESLDVSNNQLSGSIPYSMTSMTSLAYLNLSNNNFSGIIPDLGQMTTFDGSSYSGNPGLCGLPLLTSCLSGALDTRGTVEDDSENLLKDKWFYSSVGWGFATGILVPLGILAIRKPWSDAYFGFVDNLINRQMGVSRATSYRNRRRR